MKKFWIYGLILWTASSCRAPLVEDGRLVENMMKQSRKLRPFLKDKDTLGVQIIYTQIDRDSSNRPSFKSFYFNVDSINYFYPASTVKLPMVLLALEKLNQLNVRGLDKFTPMYNDSVYSGQLSVTKDSTSENGKPSVAHYAKKILLVSDNDAFNRLYEFVGQKAANQTLKSKGYNMRILHRLERPLTPDQNRHTEAVRFITADSIIYSQRMLVNEDSIRAPRKVFKGIGYEKDGAVVHKPFDFTYKNSYPLQEQQEILKAVLFPEAVTGEKRFQISEDDRNFVMKHMSQLPRESKFPPYYKDKNYFDAYCKFLMFGNSKKPIPSHIRIFNKVGDAYGYIIDNAYIVDFKNGIEFMLSAVVNTNTDGVYNDGKYEYEKIGFPFMKRLGRLVYKFEKKRHKRNSPKLDDIVFGY